MPGERKRPEDDLDPQKLMVLGRLAGGIAHDFNNQLTSIIGYTDLLLGDLAPDAPARQDLLEIRYAAERAHVVTRNLLAFSRPRPAEPAIVHVAEALVASVHLLRRVLGDDIQLVTAIERASIDREPGLVRADPSHVGHILLCLAVRARQSLPHGGTLSIEAANVAVREDGVSVSARLGDASNPTVAARVPNAAGGTDSAGAASTGSTSDTASGSGTSRAPGGQNAPGTDAAAARPREPVRYVRITVQATSRIPTSLAREWEPPLTLSPPPLAPGPPPSLALGLPVVEDIVRQCGGHVLFNRTAAGDESVILHLPRVETRDSSAETHSLLPHGMEHVLVVEDDGGVRDLVRTILERHGYQVLLAERPSQALVLAGSPQPRLDLAIVDVMLPEQRGDVLANGLTTLRPGLRVLYMSGHTDDEVGPVANGAVNFYLRKPFTPGELLITVRQAIDSFAA